MDIFKQLAIAIKQARIATGMSQEEFAERLDVSATHVKHLESGHRKPSVEILFLICQHTGLSLDHLLYEQNNETTENTLRLLSTVEFCTEEEKKLLSEIAQVIIANRNK